MSTPKSNTPKDNSSDLEQFAKIATAVNKHGIHKTMQEMGVKSPEQIIQIHTFYMLFQLCMKLMPQEKTMWLHKRAEVELAVENFHPIMELGDILKMYAIDKDVISEAIAEEIDWEQTCHVDDEETNIDRVKRLGQLKAFYTALTEKSFTK